MPSLRKPLRKFSSRSRPGGRTDGGGGQDRGIPRDGMADAAETSAADLLHAHPAPLQLGLPQVGEADDARAQAAAWP